jgi:palmitoyltransferase ZDHHC4
MFGERAGNWVYTLYHYIAKERNQFFPIVYLLGWTLLFYTWQESVGHALSIRQYNQEVLIGSIIISTCLAIFLKMLCSYPGRLTRNSAEDKVAKANRRYKRDGVLFDDARDECSTCKIKKPARSKHCSVCDTCVEKFDHHSKWFNKCVGLHNEFGYMLFTLVHAVTGYYTSIMARILLNDLRAEKKASFLV